MAKKDIKYFAKVDLNIKDKDFKAGDEITVAQPPRWMVLQGLISPEQLIKEEEE
jgi:hypothetical protein